MSEPRRFVVLTHDSPVLHWDLMLDVGDVLRTWRLAREPRPGIEIKALALGDHRRMYLDYEGPVSGGRGTVERWDAGTYMVLRESTDALTAEISGEKMTGEITLRRTDAADGWLFELHTAASQLE